MTDSDLADLYRIETRALNQALKRNPKRFPEDFMFRLTEEEFEHLRSQNGYDGRGGRRSPPYVFTEHGVLMLSSVLNSEKAIAVNIQIVRIFTQIREIMLTNKDIILQLEEMRRSIAQQDEKIEGMYEYLVRFLEQEQHPRTEIGFKATHSD